MAASPLGLRQLDIELLLVDQLDRADVSVDQDAFGVLALCGVCCLDLGVAQIGSAGIRKVEPLLAPVGQLHDGLTGGRVNASYSPAKCVDQSRIAVVAGELPPVARA